MTKSLVRILCCCALTVVLLSTTLPSVAGPPCDQHNKIPKPYSSACPYKWKQVVGQIYCASDSGSNPCKKTVTVTATLDEGTVLDESWKQTDLESPGYWFKKSAGNDEEGMQMTFPGLYVQVTGDNNRDSTRYIIFTHMTQDKTDSRKYLISADLYCEAGTARVAGKNISGGCNTNGMAWVKIIPKEKALMQAPQR